jgi:hypothetical protein
MPSPSSAGTRLRRFIALLGALVLLPLAVVLAAAPAQADSVTLTGAVEDAVGDPLAGVTVTIYEAPGDTVPAGVDDTGLDGSYSLPFLEPGTYHLVFTKDGYRESWYGDGATRETITIDADGQASNDDGALEGNVVPTQQLTSPATHAVTGTVTTGGAPIDGVTVTAYLNGDDEEPGVSTTSAIGTGGYTLALETGSYQIRYSHPSYLGTWYGAGNAASDTATDVIVRTDGSVVVGGATTGCGSSTLCGVAVVAATGTEEHAVAGTVVDANSAPIAGLTVKVLQAGTSTLVDQGTTTADGRYSIDVVAGSYNVEFSGAGWETALYRAGDGNDVATVVVATNGNLSTTPAETLSHNELRQTTIVSTPTSYSGTVVASGSHASLAGIQVAAYPDGDTDEAPVTATTDPEGDYSLSLRIGTYEIRFTDPGATYIQTWLGGSTHAAVKLAQGTPRVLTINGTPQTALGTAEMSEPEPDQTYAVSGRVVDATGAGISGVDVTAAAGSTGTTEHTTTIGDGSYTVQLEPGTYTVGGHDPTAHFVDGTLRNDDDTANAVVLVGVTGVITVDSAASNGTLDDLVLVGTPTNSINGKVRNSSSAALSGIDVTAFDFGDETTPRSTAVSNGSGAWTLAGLRIGTYGVRFKDNVADATTYSTTWLPSGGTAKEVVIAQGGRIYVDGVERSNPLADVVMPTATADTTYAVTGEVDDVVGEPLDKIHVDASVVGSGAADGAVTGPNGLFTLDLKPGSYNVAYSGTKAGGAADNYLPATYRNDGDEIAVILVALDGTVTVQGNAEPNVPGRALDSVTLVGPATHTLSGTVVGAPGGTALAGITVDAIVDGESVPAVGATTTTNASGGFTLSLPVNNYKVRFTDNVSDGKNYRVTWFGGGPTALVTVGTGGVVKYNNGTVAGLGTVTMPEVAANTRFDLAGTVYEPVEFEPLDGVTVTAVPVSGTAGGNGGTDVTGADTPATGVPLGTAGVYRIPVLPGKYQLRFSKPGFATAYLMNDEGDVSVPATLTVGPTGTINAPGLELTNGVVDDFSMLFTAATFKTAPKLSGKAAVAQTVTTSFGALQGAGIDNDYVTIEWFLDGKSADDWSTGSFYQKFEVPASAAGKRLSYRVSIDDPDSQRATSVFTSKAVVVKKAATKLKGAFKKGKLTVALTLVKPTVPKKSLPQLTGKILVKDGKKTVATIKLKAKSKGKGVVKLTKLKAGKHKLTLVYAGAKGVNAAKATMKVKI